MGVLLQASSRENGIWERGIVPLERTVDVRNDQGGTHRVLNEILSIHKTIGLRAVFYFYPLPAPGTGNLTWR